MVDTKMDVAAPAAAPATAEKSKKINKRIKKHSKAKQKNRSLKSGRYRYIGRKRSAWSFVGKSVPKKNKKKQPLVIEKPIGGEKNGGTRLVSLQKKKKSYPTTDRIRKRPPKTFFKNHRRHLRSSLVPGKVVIILVGPYKGYRAVFLKQLASGLLLITGPFHINGIPLRRIHQRYVIATSTQIDLSDVKIPPRIDDYYFKRIKVKRSKKPDGDIFVSKKEPYKPSKQRLTDQKAVDDQIKIVMKKPGHTLLKRYLRSTFGLRTRQFPHKMKF